MKRLMVWLAFLAVKTVCAQTITYANPIKDLVLRKCASCHQPGEAAPFPLLTYTDISKRLSFIRKVIENNYMPPWKADNSYVHFSNDRSLTPAEKQLLLKWIDNKAPEGKPAGARKTEGFYGNLVGRKPDLMLTTGKPFTTSGDNVERFVIFKIPFSFKDSSNVEAVEFYSTNKKIIHHANFAVHPVEDESIGLDGTDAYINLTDGSRSAFDQYQRYRKKISYYGGWIPGTSYESYPGDFGWVLPKRGVILLTVHYTASSIPDSNICGISLFFKKNPIIRPVKVISFGSGGIGEHDIFPPLFIKANQKKKFTLSVSNPREDFSIMYVWPHMHFLGKEFKAYVTTTENDTIKLVHIPDWDYRWQEIYKFKKLVKVPSGSVVHIEAEYDNTRDNPFNPFDPPEDAHSFGDMISTNEMLTMLMIFLPYKEGDENLSLE